MAVASRKPAGGRDAKSSAAAALSAAAKRQLVLITHARYPIGEPRAERAAKAARDAGYRVQVIALREPGEPLREVVDDVEVRRLRIRHVRRASALRMAFEYISFTLLATAATIALRRRQPVHVIEVHAPPPFLILAGLIPRILGAKLLLDIRDLSPHLWDARFGRSWAFALIQRALWMSERMACAIADRVITVHEPYRQELAQHGVCEEAIAVVMNAPDDLLLGDVRKFKPDRGGSDAFTVVYHGTITSWYGVDLLVRAIATLSERVPAAGALIIGEGDGLPGVKELARELGVAERISFSGRYLPIREALASVAAADCGVIPNTASVLNQFILPNKLFEYVALGIPVVAGHLDTVAAHFNDDEVTFFAPGDTGSLALAIRWVAEHRAEARTKACRARERADAYRWAEQRAHYIDVVDQCLQPAP